jgi:hypothetical protein
MRLRGRGAPSFASRYPSRRPRRPSLGPKLRIAAPQLRSSRPKARAPSPPRCAPWAEAPTPRAHLRIAASHGSIAAAQSHERAKERSTPRAKSSSSRSEPPPTRAKRAVFGRKRSPSARRASAACREGPAPRLRRPPRTREAFAQGRERSPALGLSWRAGDAEAHLSARVVVRERTCPRRSPSTASAASAAASSARWPSASVKDLELVAINDLTDAKTLAHLYNYDSVHGRATHPATALEGVIDFGRHKAKVIAEKDPAKLPWKELGVDIVLECTGLFTDKEKAVAPRRRREEGHHQRAGQGARRDDRPRREHRGLRRREAHIISCGSCTTNCLAPSPRCCSTRSASSAA